MSNSKMQEIKLFNTQISIYYFKRNSQSNYLTIRNPLVKCNGKHYTFEYYNDDKEFVVANAILITDSLYLHSMEEPALNAPGEIDFFMYGHPVMIEDLHCDDEVRLCLKLKYTLIGQDEKDFYTYTT